MLVLVQQSSNVARPIDDSGVAQSKPVRLALNENVCFESSTFVAREPHDGDEAPRDSLLAQGRLDQH